MRGESVGCVCVSRVAFEVAVMIWGRGGVLRGERRVLRREGRCVKGSREVVEGRKEVCVRGERVEGGGVESGFRSGRYDLGEEGG